MNRRKLLMLLSPACLLSIVEAPARWRNADHGGSDTPAFHSHPPTGPLPPALSPKLLSNPSGRIAYAMAAKIRPVLYQQPCYCYCDRGFGHKSLLDCYVGRHAFECDACQKQAIYAYGQTLAGRSPEQIREGMIRKEWENVDLAKVREAALLD